MQIPRAGQIRALIARAINKTLGRFNYVVEKLPERDVRDDRPAPTDEVIAGPWISHVLQMVNRNYRPQVLHYHRREIEDERLKYIAYFLDVRDLRILEIGPLEGYHSVVLEKMGVRENLAIEGRADNLRKCQRIKEKFQLVHTQFLQYDLERLYRGEDIPSFNGPFDLVFCLGVLYHLPDPGRGLEWMRSQSNTLFLGTNYVARNRGLLSVAARERNSIYYTYLGKSYRGQEFAEGGIACPGAGMSPTSVQLYEDDLIRLIQDVGYSRTWVLGKDIHNHVDHITILAEA
jgi:hypothetical protein